MEELVILGRLADMASTAAGYAAPNPRLGRSTVLATVASLVLGLALALLRSPVPAASSARQLLLDRNPNAVRQVPGSPRASATESASCAPGVTSIYTDRAGDAGDAPDLSSVAITPCADTLRFDITLAQPTQLGHYGWILVGIDTDRKRSTGSTRFGNEYLVVANGDATDIGSWNNRHFDFGFTHSDLGAKLTPTELTFTIDTSDFRQRRFNFEVASLRQSADLAPDSGAFSYPKPEEGKSRRLPLAALTPLVVGGHH